jgi:hypothetical protein
LARTLASPRLGRKPKARVATLVIADDDSSIRTLMLSSALIITLLIGPFELFFLFCPIKCDLQFWHASQQNLEHVI